MDAVQIVAQAAKMAESAKHLDYILLIGLAVFFGTVGAGIFQKLRFPQIIGYVIIGALLGPGLNVISPEDVHALEGMNVFALGLIGFLIGGELKLEIFKKYGKQVSSILFFEGMTAFFLVGILSLAVLGFDTSTKLMDSLAMAIVFGAICAATDPASTINVLWEYKTRGPLTTMLKAIVALDDALALGLYAVGVSIASVITSSGSGADNGGFWSAFGVALYELFGSVVLGYAIGSLLSWLLRKIEDEEKILVFTLSCAIVVIGIARQLHMDVILAAMAVGVALINSKSRRAEVSFKLMHSFSGPIYVFFFVLVGARLRIDDIETKVVLLALVYVVGSIVGKTAGSYWGGKYSRSAVSVTKYLGYCLYPQGGIAVGLLLMASQRFPQEQSDLMLLVVIIGAFVLQLIGPLGVKFGATKAGEVGLNVTEEDLIKQYNVKDLMDKKCPVIEAGMCLNEVIGVVSDTESMFYPVVDRDRKLIGAVTFDGIRNTFATQELNDWLVALDIVEPVREITMPETTLRESVGRMRETHIDYFPVVDSEENMKLKGLLSYNAVQRRLSAEVLSKQKEADRMYGMTAMG